MEYEIFTICDNAQNYDGKMVIVGTFDTIFSKSFPMTCDAFSLAVKINCTTSEITDPKIQIDLKEKDSGVEVCPQINAQIPLNPGTPDQSISLVINFQKISFMKPGDYHVDFKFNGETRRRPLHLKLQ